MNYHFKWTYWCFYYEPSKCLIKAASVTFWQSYLETLFCYVQRFQIQVLIFVFFFLKGRFWKTVLLDWSLSSQSLSAAPSMFNIVSPPSNLYALWWDIHSFNSFSITGFCFLLFLFFVLFSAISLCCFWAWISLGLSHLRFTEPLESTRKGLCLSPNLGSFWPLFL